MRLDKRRTVLVGFAFLAICAFWQMYNNVVPLILTNTFHMNETWSGAIMAADNVAGLFLLPLWLAMASGGANANLMASALVSQYGRANYASVWSVLFTGASLIRNLCYLLIGAIASLSGTYARVYLFWGVISAFSFVLLAVSNFKYRPAPRA